MGQVKNLNAQKTSLKSKYSALAIKLRAFLQNGVLQMVSNDVERLRKNHEDKI